MISTNDLKNGITIEVDGAIFVVMETQHVKPGKGAAIVKAKLKNLRTGAIFEKTFNAGVKVATARIEKTLMQYLYCMGDTYYFMNMDTYEQLELDKSSIGDGAKFLKENLEVYITTYEGLINTQSTTRLRILNEKHFIICVRKNDKKNFCRVTPIDTQDKHNQYAIYPRTD